MKKIKPGLLAFALAACAALATKAGQRSVESYYQFYTDSTGVPVLFAGTGERFLLTGCKFGPITCGKIYTAADVAETAPGSGIYEVLSGHENNQIATYNKTAPPQ